MNKISRKPAHTVTELASARQLIKFPMPVARYEKKKTPPCLLPGGCYWHGTGGFCGVVSSLRLSAIIWNQVEHTTTRKCNLPSPGPELEPPCPLAGQRARGGGYSVGHSGARLPPRRNPTVLWLWPRDGNRGHGMGNGKAPRYLHLSFRGREIRAAHQSPFDRDLGTWSALCLSGTSSSIMVFVVVECARAPRSRCALIINSSAGVPCSRLVRKTMRRAQSWTVYVQQLGLPPCCGGVCRQKREKQFLNCSKNLRSNKLG